MKHDLPAAPTPAHARLSPSSAHRWMVCPGSVRMVTGLPHTSSHYAELGVAAHLLFEMCMRLGVLPEEWLGKTLHNHVVDQDMVDAVGHACDYVYGYLNRHPTADWHPEQRVYPGTVIDRDDIWGTADLTIMAPHEIVVLDYKHGAGVYVEVADNEQLMLYALGAVVPLMEEAAAQNLEWDLMDIAQIRLVIVQPRVFGAGGPVREQVISWGDMVSFIKRLAQAAAATDDLFAPLVVGDHCRFCAASPRCPKLAEHALSTAAQEFIAVEDHKPITTAQPVRELLSEDFSYCLNQVPIIRAWCNAIEAEAELALLRGEAVQGYKLVYGRASYSWAAPSPEIMAKLLAAGLTPDQIEKRELISPAQARTLLGGKSKKSKFTTEIAQYVQRNQPKLTIAAASDPRDAVSPLQADFTNLDEEDLLS